jgi:hypothetical protein
MQREANLLQVVLTLRRPSRLAGRLNGRQQKRHKNADNRDNDEQFNKG